MSAWRGLAAAVLLFTPTALAGSAGPAPGDLDATFGTAGYFTANIGSGDAYPSSLSIQEDGKIVVSGTVVDYRPLPPPPPPPPPAPEYPAPTPRSGSQDHG